MTRAILCRVGEPAVAVDLELTYETMSKLVEGYIEYTPLADGVELLANEEGAINGMPFNRIVPGKASPLPAWLATPASELVIDMTGGRAAAPGTWGVHRVHGTFLLTRTDSQGSPASITPRDEEKWITLLNSVFS